ncbi:hypothetical protein ACSEBU_004153, partial [Yersinia enterocolitica]
LFYKENNLIPLSLYSLSDECYNLAINQGARYESQWFASVNIENESVPTGPLGQCCRIFGWL